MLTENPVLRVWLEKNLPVDVYNISRLAGDASLRQYYRITFENESRILMDSSLEKLAFEKFITITDYLGVLGLPVPKIYAANNDEALALLEDLGDKLLLDSVSSNNYDDLYKSALDILIKIENSTHPSCGVPYFTSQQILNELNLFNEWFVNKYLQVAFSNSEQQVITQAFALIVEEILTIPHSFAVMDYHSRNIMVSKNKQLNIIDYQDAKIAPFPYDLVSIIKDCYIKLPQDFVNELLSYYHSNSHLAKSLTKSKFIRAFNLCGLQRHIKVLGIFSRLHIRDKKNKYLDNLPLVLLYTLDCLKQYSEFADFYEIMQKLSTHQKFELNYCD